MQYRRIILESFSKRSRPPLQHMLIFLVYIAFFSLCMIYFFYSWPETLDCTLSNTKFLTLPPNLVFQNSLHRQFIHIKYVVSRWSSGNRRRATSAREVIEVAGSNHAIGVILNLAWGPSNFSPRNFHFCFCCFSLLFLLIIIIFILFFLFPLFLFQSLRTKQPTEHKLYLEGNQSLRTGSNSQTGLGAEELLPAKFSFLLLLFFSSFSPYYHHFHLIFSFSLIFVSEQFSFSGHFVNC